MVVAAGSLTAALSSFSFRSAPASYFFIETHSLPTLARCYPHSFAFYVAYPARSILNSSAPDIKEARELAFKSSPVASIANWRSPVLLVHGDDDRNVPFQQTTDLV